MHLTPVHARAFRMEFIEAYHTGLRCCRCGDVPAEPCRVGCVPCTAVVSIRVDKRTHHCPVWFDENVITLFKLIQYHSRQEAADTALAYALAAQHRMRHADVDFPAPMAGAAPNRCPPVCHAHRPSLALDLTANPCFRRSNAAHPPNQRCADV